MYKPKKDIKNVLSALKQKKKLVQFPFLSLYYVKLKGDAKARDVERGYGV